MSPRKFDRFMVDVHIASNPKLSRLTVSERWCHVAGVLSLAALAPIRGRLLIGDEPAEAADVARRAGVSVGVARSTLQKLRKVGVIVPDEDLRCERVHDFEDWNPAPKTDSTNAERQARYRAKRNGVTGVVTNGSVTPTEVEVEEKGRELPPDPPMGGNPVFPSLPGSTSSKRRRDQDRQQTAKAEHRVACRAFAAQHFPGEHPDLIVNTAAFLSMRRVEPTVDKIREQLATSRAPEVSALPPDSVGGRDDLSYGLEFNSWVAQNFPGVQPGLVDRCVSVLRSRGVEPTVDALRPLVEADDVLIPKEAA